MFTPLTAQAYQFANDAHRGQKRKYIDNDYMVHPMRVASSVFHYLVYDTNVTTADIQNAVAAALLHDTIEDCDTSYDDVVDHFGYDIANLVTEVTNPSIYTEGMNRKDRKALDKDHIAKSSYLGASIKLADIIDNCTDIVAYDPDFARVYLKEKKEAISVLHGNDDLIKIALQTVELGLKMVAFEE